MVQRTVLKVDISCEKCKQKLMKAVSGLEGVDKIEVDVPKGTLTVTGDADPIDLIVRARRRTGKYAEVVSVGPLKADGGGGGGSSGQKKAAAKGKKLSEDKKVEETALPSTCHICQQMGFHQAYMPCSIL